jgi:hypothetical protein
MPALSTKWLVAGTCGVLLIARDDTIMLDLITGACKLHFLLSHGNTL